MLQRRVSLCYGLLCNELKQLMIIYYGQTQNRTKTGNLTLLHSLSHVLDQYLTKSHQWPSSFKALIMILYNMILALLGISV